MVNTVVVGLQLGDEGKGKVCDYLMQEHDICVRYNGGPNTGATVWVGDKKYKFHHIPVGVIQNKPSYIASTCYVNPLKLLKEIETLKTLGIDVSNLKISPYCHTITETHLMQDSQTEQTSQGVGSTKQGISPCARDKFSRTGFRLHQWNAIEHSSLEKHFVDVSGELNYWIQNKKSILFEGAQGTLLDIDHGLYPWVSTSNNVAGAAAMACGIGPQHINKVVGVFKPYVTYVGNNEFQTEIKDQKLNDLIVELGHEYGTTTGRRRRVGWLSLPLLHYACMVNGVTDLAVTKGDVLEGLEFQMDQDFYDYKDPLWLTNYKANLSLVYPSEMPFSLDSFVSLFNMEFASYGIPKIKYVSTGKERNEMIVSNG